MANELVQVPDSKVQEVFVSGGLDPYIAKIKDHLKGIVPDLSTDKGRKEIASNAHKVAKSRTYLDGVGKDYVAKLKELPKTVDAERKRMREELEAFQAEIRKPLTEWEDAEKDRIAKHEGNIQWMVDAGNQFTEFWDSVDISKMQETISKLNDSVIDESWDEYKDRALQVREQTVLILEALISKREKKDAEQAELEELRKKQAEQEQKDREARIAQEAAAKAKAEAEDKARAEIEKAQKAERDAKEAAEKAERDRVSAIEAEKQEAARVKREAEAKAKQAAEAEQKRQANKAHRAKIEAEAIKFIAGINGVTDEQAASIVSSISNGEVPHVSIAY